MQYIIFSLSCLETFNRKLLVELVPECSDIVSSVLVVSTTATSYVFHVALHPGLASMITHASLMTYDVFISVIGEAGGTILTDAGGTGL